MKIVVGLSGGVDSAVAAFLLKQAGHSVVGVFMQNWHNTEGTLHGNCLWEDDLDFARMVARKLDIPFEFVDLSSEYSKRVVDYMFAEYEKGRTPNPDVLCNREIKFDVFMDVANRLGADRLATGHYCRVASTDDGKSNMFRLLAGTDPNKDQSYFLCQLSQKQLSQTLFPIGGLLKQEVRRIAAEQRLPNADRKDSQGICFVGKVDLPVFLQQKLSAKTGDVVEIMPQYYQTQTQTVAPDNCRELAKPFVYSPADGKKIGTHNGAHFFTTGQRKGINIGGHVEPLFVIATDVKTNTLYVGEGRQHRGLYRQALHIMPDEIHWIRPDLALAAGETLDCRVRIRYRQPLQQARLMMKPDGMYVVFQKPQRGITAGQFAAWYIDDELIGSGTIN
ncbi:MAG: tRNA 2-thiouridine(34) synthase MnmA [Prevotellaceae bacterium]|jgi:tRNA-specific 2-thiouridylase|nr:tRNA 2-thiouridine(34) synthase MnmA [Prevotellaceae bacterium]